MNISYKDLKKYIEQYHSINFKDTLFADVDKLFKLIINNFITQTILWKEPYIYRARKHEVCNSLFKNTEQLIYRKKEEVTELGRLNNIKESIFYGASNPGTALMEMQPEIGDEITILESRLINKENFPNLVEVGIRELMSEQNHSPEFIKQNKEFLKKNLRTKDDEIFYDLRNSFLIKEMRKIVNRNEKYNYVGTITIGSYFMNPQQVNNFVDGIIYQSINRNGSDCIALKPDSYDKYYKPYSCFKIKVLSINDREINTRYIYKSTKVLKGGKIEWNQKNNSKEK